MEGDPRVDDGSVPPIDTTLRRIVVAYRILSLLWLIGLCTSTLATDDGAAGWAVWSAIGVAVALTSAVVLRGRRRESLIAPGYLALDVAGSAYIGLAPGFAGSVHLFIGGFLLSTLVLVLYARPGWPTGGATALILTATQVIVPLISDAREFEMSDALGNVLAILVTGLVFGWGMEALRRSERRRMSAEMALQQERLLRERMSDRADIADHLHDSVLQTLALIEQRSADRPDVRTLARRQERELRAFLDRMASPFPDSFKAALREAATAVEDLYEVQVEVVIAGDHELDEQARAVVAAAKEAMANAARHSGMSEVSVYGEAVDHSLTVFVRDRGSGFDPETVGTGHRGITDSIVDRMERHGGSATVHSQPEVGTEIELRTGTS